MELLGCLVILAMDFGLAALGFWIITLLLPLLGIELAWSWGGAFVCWVILKIIKIIS